MELIVWKNIKRDGNPPLPGQYKVRSLGFEFWRLWTGSEWQVSPGLISDFGNRVGDGWRLP